MSRKSEPKKCDSCGVPREIMIIAPKIRKQDEEGYFMEMGFKSQCIPCLLERVEAKLNKKSENKLMRHVG